MLQTIRDRATGWIAYIIVALLIIPFALWGVNEYFDGGQTLDAAEVGDMTIPLQEFQQAYQEQRQRLQALLGDRYDPALFDEVSLKREVLEQLVNERVLLQAARKEGFRVGDRQLSVAIQSYEAFHENGAFNPELYQSVLRSQGYSPLTFEEGLRTSLVTGQLQQGVAMSSLVTPADLDRLVGLLTQKRELSHVLLSLNKYQEKVSVDDAAIEAYYEENKDRLLKPEQVRMAYLDLDAERMATDLAVSEEQLRAAYREQIAKYAQEEERGASHILIRVPEGAGAADRDEAQARAQRIHEEIASGAKTFEQALQEAEADGGAEGGNLGSIGKGMLDPAFESALFALAQQGDISEPVKTPFGYHIIRLDGIAAARVKEFAEVQDELAQELRRRTAEARFYDEAETLYNLTYEHPDSLEPAAKALGLTVAESQWFTRQEGEGIAAYPDVVTAAFSEEVLSRGLNSEPVQVGANRVIVVRKLDHKDAVPQTLDEARAEIVRELRTSRAREALRTDSEAVRKRVDEGESLDALATEFGGEYKPPALVRRTDTAIDAAVLAEAFRLLKPEEGKVSLGAALLASGDQAVVAVSQVVPGTLEDLPEAERAALERRLEGQVGAAEFQSYLDSLRKHTKVVLHSDRL